MLFTVVFLPYLMVPVGDGSGEPNALMCSSCCCIVGMLILRGEMWGRSGRGGGEGCSFSLCSSKSRSDINWILITVLGKRNTHLGSRRRSWTPQGRRQKQREKDISSYSLQSVNRILKRTSLVIILEDLYTSHDLRISCHTQKNLNALIGIFRLLNI